MKVLFYRDRKKEWRWKAVARNGRIVATGAEGYKSKAKCLDGFFALQDSYPRFFEGKDEFWP